MNTVKTIWSGYSVSYSGMSTAQRSLGVTSSNLSNTNTEGYSRKRAVSEEVYSADGTPTGIGANVQSILRIRNQFLDLQYRQQNTQTGYSQGKSALLENLQEVVNEFNAPKGETDTGLQQTITDFFKSWTELSNDPSSPSAKSSVLETANSLLGTFDEISTTLQTFRESMVDNVRDSVKDVNTLASKIAELNQQIMEAETHNVEASDLRDARDLMIDKVSAMVNVTTSDQNNGTVNVYVNGVSLVNGNRAREMEATGIGIPGNLVKVQWKDLGMDVSLTGGSLKAYMEEADPTGVDAIVITTTPPPDPKIVPYNWETTANKSALTTLTNGLSDLMVTIAAAVNNIYNPTQAAGQDFFTNITTGTHIGLRNVQVNPTYADYTQIKANSDGTAGNNDVSKKIGAVLNDGQDFECDGITMNLGTFYSSVISWMGTAGDTAKAEANTQSGLLTQLDGQRKDVSSVSQDEEMSTMLTYQHAYSASARVMNVVDTLVAGLIADLGGR